ALRRNAHSPLPSRRASGRRLAMRRILIVLALLTAAPPAVHAQAGAGLAGTVRTADGTPVPNLVLVLRGPGGVRTVVTGPEGRYRVSGLEAGRYQVALRAPGFLLAGSPEAEVSAGSAGPPATLDLTLAPAPVREHVVVAATRDEAALSTVGVTATVLDSERIERRGGPSVLTPPAERPGRAVARPRGLRLPASVSGRVGDGDTARD